MTDADAVLAGVYRALVPGGTFVAELGGQGNTASLLDCVLHLLWARGIDGAALVPWYFPSPAEYAARLERAGFRVEALWYFDRPTRLPSDVVGWLQTFGDSFTRALPAHERAGFLNAVREELRPELCRADGSWMLDYVRLRFVARRPNAARAAPRRAATTGERDHRVLARRPAFRVNG
jgi:trans-aconitate methyltransferase